MLGLKVLWRRDKKRSTLLVKLHSRFLQWMWHERTPRQTETRAECKVSKSAPLYRDLMTGATNLTSWMERWLKIESFLMAFLSSHWSVLCPKRLWRRGQEQSKLLVKLCRDRAIALIIATDPNPDPVTNVALPTLMTGKIRQLSNGPGEPVPRSLRSNLNNNVSVLVILQWIWSRKPYLDTAGLLNVHGSDLIGKLKPRIHS